LTSSRKLVKSSAGPCLAVLLSAQSDRIALALARRNKEVHMETTVRNRLITALLIALLVATLSWTLPPLTCLQLPASAQTTCYLPIVFKSWPPVPEQPSLLPIDNADGDGSYSVNWAAAARADDYELQEKWQAQDWFTAYLGSATHVDLSGRPAGTYTYRCRARNSWGESVWSNEVTAVVQGKAPGTITRPSCSTVSAGGQAIVKVINDCPYALYLDFTGPQPTTMQLPLCSVCSVYTFIGPIFCPTSNRPIQEQQMPPGNYRVFVTVQDPSVRPYQGLWSLSGNCRYSVCFYILRSYSSAEGQTAELVPGVCD
jgi:hypothetical protein